MFSRRPLCTQRDLPPKTSQPVDALGSSLMQTHACVLRVPSLPANRPRWRTTPLPAVEIEARQRSRLGSYTRGVSRPSSLSRPISFVLCVAIPLAVAALVNAVVRPALAERLGGSLRRSMSTAKSADRWWEFEPATREAHPMLTGFLQLSDGAVAMAMLGVATLAAIVFLARDRRRERDRTAP